MKARSLIVWSIIMAIALVAAVAAAPADLARAISSSLLGHDFNVTFTKWVTELPNMAGVGGGAIGPASFTGEIVDLTVEGNMEYVEAVYHFKGARHSFTAHINATQNDTLGTGTITGRVTEGWQKGATLRGEYNVLAECPIETPGNGMGTLCFQGVLHLHRGP